MDFGAGRVAVTLDYTRKRADTEIAVYHIDGAGDLTRVPGAEFADGKVRFETNHWSVYAVVEMPSPSRTWPGTTGFLTPWPASAAGA